jgi:hypothetical protein
MNLTALTKADVAGQSKTQIVRDILRRQPPNIPVAKVIQELKRLSGQDCDSSLVYSLRKEVANGQITQTIPQVPPTPKVEQNPAPPRLKDVELYFAMKKLVVEMGGVERAQQFLDFIKSE